MNIIPKMKYLSLLFILMISCNQIEKSPMKEFEDGKITKLEKNENGYSLMIETARDSSVVAFISNQDFKDQKEVLQNISKNQKISFKGMIYYAETKETARKAYFEKSSVDKQPVTFIKEIKFLD